MIRSLRVVRAASTEFAAAVRWYEAHHPGLGSEFFEAVVDTTRRVQENPLIGKPLSSDERTRRMLLRRFPYQVVYRLLDDEILVIAVAHLKRRPGYWKDRE